MAWIIDKDHIADLGRPKGTNANAVGLMGPGGYAGNGTELTKHFRMLDGDNEVYYEGRNDTDDDNNAFGPLDDFGGPNAGCTAIEYLDANGKWKLL